MNLTIKGPAGFPNPVEGMDGTVLQFFVTNPEPSIFKMKKISGWKVDVGHRQKMKWPIRGMKSN